ncbi:DUF4132 domain-containing protein [Catenuloplanes sp. NPDC051500]|uniref:DUF4132 domain-containing protein n=1 Tax=Catenuloplanes sp. NPDC051500 TaxID=3363959 RepID=UPI0037AE63C2
MRFDDSWVMPEDWRGKQLPRRGGMPFEVPPADPGAPGRLAALLADSDLRAARNAEYHPTLLDEARRFASDLARPEAELSPRGAAAAGLIVAEYLEDWGYWRREPEPAVAQTWIARGGVVFAVRAVAEMAGMLFHPLRRDEALVRRPVGRILVNENRGETDLETLRRWDEDGALFKIARWVRIHLAAADDATFALAADALGEYRDGPLPQRIIAAFVLPDREDWVVADVDEIVSWHGRYPEVDRNVLYVLPAFSTSSVATLHRHSDAFATLDENERRGRYDSRLESVSAVGRETMIATLLDAFGTEAVPILTEHPIYRGKAWYLSSFAPSMGVRDLATVLQIPADETVRYAIRVTLVHRQGEFQQLGMMAADPVRTMRMLAEPDAPPIAADVLGMYVLAKPALLDLLNADDRARVTEIVGDGSGVGARMAAALDEGGWFHGHGIDRKQIVTWLASIDTDEAFGLLAVRADEDLIRPVAVRLAARRPGRALRVLAGLTPERPEAATVVAELLRNHVLSHPDLVATTVPELEAEARARVAAITTALTPSGPVAPESALPAALQDTPKAKPLPSWLVVPLLPPVRLRGHGGAALPEPAVRRLLALLSLSTFAAPHPGLAEVRDACEREDLTAFGWALFAQWESVSHPSGDKQALYALGFLGDDSAAPRLTEEVLGWTEDAIARAKIGLDVFVALGTDTALTHLQRMSRTAKAKGFRKLAAQKLEEIAAARGLTTAELGDRIVSDLGLDADGRRTLDYGARRFTVTFDVKLNPLISDADGRRVKGLPRVSAADDAARADEARLAFAALKKEARALGTDRIRALEDAMVAGRSWSAAELRTLLLDHPVVRYPARALLWQAAGGVAFRVAEDGTLADVDDKTITLADDARVGLYHPALAGPEQSVWAEVFADYEIFQPFAQLDREVYRPDAVQAAAHTLPLDTGSDGDLDILHPLVAKGWRFTSEGGVAREWAGGFVTHITPYDVSVTSPRHATFGELGPVAVSETFRDAFRLTQRA